MIESALIMNIIDVTLEGEKHAEQLNNQVKHLEEVEYEHMDTGLIVFLDPTSGIDTFRLTNEQLVDTFGESDHELTKVALINEELKIHADVSVHLVNGIIDRIEIWNKLGEYPEDDLATWELKPKKN